MAATSTLKETRKASTPTMTMTDRVRQQRLLQRAVRHLPVVPQVYTQMLSGPAAHAFKNQTWAIISSDGIKCMCCDELISPVWKWSNMKRHHTCKKHLRAVKKLLNIEDAQVLVDSAPSDWCFQQVWKAVRAGRSSRQGVEGVGSRHKVVRLMRCLSRAMFALDRPTIGHDIVAACSSVPVFCC